MLSKDFKNDLIQIHNKIKSREPFVLARYADGEKAVIENRKIRGIDGWTITDEDKAFGLELESTLLHQEANYFYGISCPCCDRQSYNFYNSYLKSNWHNVTYSNIFTNSNWIPAANMLLSIPDREFICNLERTSIPPIYNVSSDVLKDYQENRDSIHEVISNIATLKNEKTFLIAAGPLAEIIIHWMYLANPNNQYIDVGSSLDPIFTKRGSRDYHYSGSLDSLKVCSFNI